MMLLKWKWKTYKCICVCLLCAALLFCSLYCSKHPDLSRTAITKRGWSPSLHHHVEESDKFKAKSENFILSLNRYDLLIILCVNKDLLLFAVRPSMSVWSSTPRLPLAVVTGSNWNEREGIIFNIVTFSQFWIQTRSCIDWVSCGTDKTWLMHIPFFNGLNILADYPN